MLGAEVDAELLESVLDDRGVCLESKQLLAKGTRGCIAGVTVFGVARENGSDVAWLRRCCDVQGV